MRSFLASTFLRGLAIVAPITLTLYVLYWLGSTAEQALGPWIERVLPDGYYVRGVGVVAGFAVVFGIGVLMNVWLAREIVRFAERILEKIPLVKTLYGSVRDLMGFFASGDKKKQLDQVVLVEIHENARVLGFVTREHLDEILGGANEDDRIAVYLPMSYQIGGFTLLVPRSKTRSVDMSVEEGLRFAMTAGVSKEAETPESSLD